MCGPHASRRRFSGVVNRSSAPRGTRPPRRGIHGAPASSSSSSVSRSAARPLASAWRSSAANSASRAFHTSGPFGCLAAALASRSGPASARHPPDLCREPGGLIWPPGELIGATSTGGKRSAIARARSRSSRQGSGAANRT